MKKLLFVTVFALFALQCRFWGQDPQLSQRPVYRLHVGDVIALNYRLTPEFNQTVTVQPDGFVNLDEVGSVKVAGLTLDQAHNEIVRLASIDLNHPQLSISLKQFVEPYVVVAGQVARPGKIEIQEDTTALQAVMLAGGFLPTAEESQVILFRHINGDMAEVRRLNLHSIKKHSQLERDAELEPGDMLLVTTNKLEHFSRIMKATDLGVYFNPVTGVPIP